MADEFETPDSIWASPGWTWDDRPVARTRAEYLLATPERKAARELLAALSDYSLLDFLEHNDWCPAIACDCGYDDHYGRIVDAIAAATEENNV